MRLIDRVHLRNVGIKGNRKPANIWGEHVYVGLEQPTPGIPVYRVKREDGEGGVGTDFPQVYQLICHQTKLTREVDQTSIMSHLVQPRSSATLRILNAGQSRILVGLRIALNRWNRVSVDRQGVGKHQVGRRLGSLFLTKLLFCRLLCKRLYQVTVQKDMSDTYFCFVLDSD